MRVAIIGTGNIGTDLLLKVQRSSWLECALFSGRNLDSPGMRTALLYAPLPRVESVPRSFSSRPASSMLARISTATGDSSGRDDEPFVSLLPPLPLFSDVT